MAITDIRNDDGVLTGWATNCSACHKVVNFEKVSELTRGRADESTHPPDGSAQCGPCYREGVAAYRRDREAQLARRAAERGA